MMLVKTQVIHMPTDSTKRIETTQRSGERNTSSQLAQFGLWQLISPTLPIGAYSYSQGLESAIEAAWVHDVDSAYEWINGIAEHAFCAVDLPILIRLFDALQMNDLALFANWNAQLLSMRESRELLDEDRQMGAALLRLIENIEPESNTFEATKIVIERLKNELNHVDISYAAALVLAAVPWRITQHELCAGYLWAWHENQIAAAIKLIPLGQTHGQQLLRRLAGQMDHVIQQAYLLNDADLGYSLPGLAMASGWHETQYTRLFRS